uniref:Uncharacterized protein n=1 Tax=uncultured marine microorganism HF4000_48F7 TaxID=455500 RepID=B3SZW7_9ZZZZ|nr:hypothetical protein ALOHA_HF400048F7ctg2g3 [uncultured marine microorganism HF4000_48F7]
MDTSTIDIHPLPSGMFSVSANDGSTTWPDQPTIEDCLECAISEIMTDRNGELLVAIESIYFWQPSDSDFDCFTGVKMYEHCQWQPIENLFDPTSSATVQQINQRNQ